MGSSRQTGKARGSSAKASPKPPAREPRVDAEAFTGEQQASHQRVRDAMGTGGKPGPKRSGKTVRCRVVDGQAKDCHGLWVMPGQTGDFAVEQVPHKYLKPL